MATAGAAEKDQVRAASTFRVVRASAAEAADAVRMIEEYQDAVGVIVRDSADDIATALKSSGKAIWLAYDLDGSATGCIAYRKLDHLAHSGEVKRLYVQPAHRGRGIAQELLRDLEQYAVSQQTRALYLDTKDDLQSAIQFYERAGYVRCERYNDNPQATIFMRRELEPAPLKSLTIRPFDISSATDAEAFRVLNEAWISALFKIEDKDREVLGDPVRKIIQPGGQIFMALRGGVVIGCCALIAMGEGSYELAKMAVAEAERGRGVGRELLAWIVTTIHAQGARRLYLETNHKLHNAIHLYEQVGFRHTVEHTIGPSRYERADVFMELVFAPALTR